jgi:hypothetical protein
MRRLPPVGFTNANSQNRIPVLEQSLEEIKLDWRLIAKIDRKFIVISPKVDRLINLLVGCY